MRGGWGWTLFGFIWGMAIEGIIVTIVFKDKIKPIMIISYVVMGLLVVIAFKPMLLILPQKMIVCLFIGGVCYISGIIFYLWKKLPYRHPIWHLFVLAGSISHFFGILFFLT